MAQTLYDKLWDAHLVEQREDGTALIYIDRHLLHEVTSPQAFEGLVLAGRPLWRRSANLEVPDHNVSTLASERRAGLAALPDAVSRLQLQTLDDNCEAFNVPEIPLNDPRQGIVHVMGPEQGAVLPGMTVVCGDSHTSTHGAFGCVSLGIGTSQVRDVLASQTLAMDSLKVRRITVNGALQNGVTAKDVILHIIRTLGVNGGVGYAYEYAGSVVDNMTMEERMTLCNMSIEGGARCGYVNPDNTTFEYLRGRARVPAGAEFDEAVERWRGYASDSDALYDDEVVIEGSDIAPTVTWGINPAQAVGIGEKIPATQLEDELITQALDYMKLKADDPIKGTPIDVAFIGSCTNGRLSDFQAVADVLGDHKVAAHVKAIVVPGSEQVDKEARALGLNEIFEKAGFEWREPGCSMCLAMNPDKLIGDEVCASSSNRNFMGRQGSPTGRTILMSPVMVAAAAVTGSVADARKVFGL